MSERYITIEHDDNGQRFDRWLKKSAPEIPYALVQKLIRKGAFKIDGKKAKADTRLATGQVVRIPSVQERQPTYDRPKPQLTEEDAAYIHSLVIYDDGDVIAINKPHGLAVQGGTNTKRHIDGMLDALIDDEGQRPRLVHRLDKDTSGVLLLARSAKVARALGQQFKSRDIKKIYWAIVAPVPDPFRGAINAPITKAFEGDREKMVVDDDEGKKAITEYEVIEHAFRKAAFVAFWPRTGRTHQIRVHAQLMGFPILGDHKYQAREEDAAPPDEAQGIEGLEYAKRLHLHAQRIICNHPTKNGVLDIHAPLPPELVKSWKSFGFDHKYKGDVFEDL